MPKFNATEFIKNYIFQHRISLQSVSKKTSIRYELLRRSIYDGARRLRADEFFEVDCYMNIDVKENQSGYYFYSFAIEKGTVPQTLLAVVSDEMSPTVPSDTTISRNDPGVNSYSMQNLENNTKKEQLELINQNNPAPNSYLTWIRTEDDIKTLSGALEDSDYRDHDEFVPDYTKKWLNRR